MVTARPGFGVAEVLVAFTVLSAGVLAVVGVAGVTARQLGEAEEVRRAARLAGHVADSLGVVPAPSPGGLEDGGMLVRWTLVPHGRGQRLRVEAGRPAAPPHVFESFIAPPPPRLEGGW